MCIVYCDIRKFLFKIKNENEDEYRTKDINIYLFFDLLQMSKTVLNLTNDSDIVVLIGDTASYLKPFLEKERKIYNLAFLNKPYWVTDPPHSNPTGLACSNL